MRSLGLLDTPAEERYDRLTRLVARLFSVPAATISVIDESREWVKSAVGFPFEQLARGASFAAHAVGTGELFIVPDAASDPRFSDHPVVAGGRRFRAYAGQPLHASDGSQVAVLSIYSDAPIRFSNSDRQAFADIAAVAERELRFTGLSAPQLEIAGATRRTETQRVDPLTRLWNRAAMFDIVRRELDEARGSRESVAFVIIDVAPPRDAVLATGEPAGEWALCEVARVLRASLRPYDVLARFSGQEFAALLTGLESSDAVEAAERVRLTIARELRAGVGHEVPVTVGVTTAAASSSEPESLARAAQTALWNAKSRGGSAVGVASLVHGG